MKKVIVTLILNLMFISGCAGPSFWFNPHKSNQETTMDINDCNFEAAKNAKIGSDRHVQLFNMCITNKGYNYVNDVNISQIGNSYYANRDYITAIGYYEKALFYRPKSIPLYNNIASSYLKLKKYDSAINYYIKSISAEPDNFIAYSGLGLAYLETNELDKSLQSIDKCLTIKPDNVGCNAEKGIYSYKNGKYNEAIIILNQSLDTTKFDIGYYYRGLTYLKMNNKEKAVDDFRAGCELMHEESCMEYKKNSRL